jgi:hypothetical protein
MKEGESGGISKRDGEMRNACKVLVGNPELERP